MISTLIKKVKKNKLSHTNNKNIVHGIGPIPSKIMIIGLAPGKDEIIQKKPFVGRAGKLLNTLLKNANIDRKKVFITNLVKSNLPKNRPPNIKEIKFWINFLYREINKVRPSIIITLGKIPSLYILKFLNIKYYPLSKIHGKIFNKYYKKKKIKLICMYHPAYGLYNPKKIKILEKDFKNLKLKK